MGIYFVATLYWIALDGIVHGKHAESNFGVLIVFKVNRVIINGHIAQSIEKQ